MLRKVLSSTLIILSSLLFILSAIGIGAAWYYNEPLTEKSTAKLTAIDDELEQAQITLVDAQGELKRAMRIVESAEESLKSFSEEKTEAIKFLDAVTGLLDDTITPSLTTSKEKLAEVQESLDGLRVSIEMLNKIPFVDIELPDADALGFFVEATSSLEKEIDNVGEMAEEAASFLNDTSYLLDGDLEETKESIDYLITVVDEYEGKIRAWREQLATLIEELPRKIDHLSVFTAVFLLWFGFSQFVLFLQGLSLWRGKDTFII